MAITPDTRIGIGSGLYADQFYSPRTPQAVIELPPVPEGESFEEREGREGEERLASLVATRPDVMRVVVHPKFSIADMMGFDLSIDFRPESGMIPVHIQSKTNRKRLSRWINETPAWLEKHHLQMSTHESHVSRRLIPMVSGWSESDDRILEQFDRRNQEIQERVRFDRSRRELVPVFAA